MKIAILILAAGTSSRMGQPKQLLAFNETTLLKTVINNTLQSNANAIFVVLGANAEQIKQSITQPVTVFINSTFKNGLSSSIVNGIRKLTSYDAVLITLGDQPFITPSYYNEMILELEKYPDYIIASQYKLHKGVPGLFPKLYYPNLLKLKADTGAKALLNSDKIRIKTINHEVNLFDIDTPEDYNKLIATNL